MEEDKIPGDKTGNDAKRMADQFEEKAREFTEEAKNTFHQAKEDWNQTTNSTENKKLLSGILAILLGSLGIHKFILGYTKEGIVLLVMSLLGFVTCGITSGIAWVVGIVEGVIYLTKTDAEFYNTYQSGRKPWF
ncbi:TM2 domain-containing protein [Dokdonia sp. Hel_I_53]|uniref:TM2 domain-containing protein n=1 Tax=Dokdonia sp. Hel_I_53 TaxID=1566287 RepID=UPI00119B0570|nr:TM2 domain-containing protein [Dokdonia sp. Hel_I_53]TVZ52491.1 TM2 domain-containing membrane protein YozV [Dokdonia sp. Hel_I_53]